MATTHSPTRSVSESPSATEGSRRGLRTRSSAISVSGSVPTTAAGSVSPEASRTLIRSAPSTT